MAITITIKRNGRVLGLQAPLLSLMVSTAFNKISEAELKIVDGDIPKTDFEILDSDDFEPGSPLEIFIREEGSPGDGDKIFSGIVVSQGLSRVGQGPALVVELCDEAVKMTSVRHNAVYTNQTDRDIIETIIARHNLTVGTLAPTTVKHAEIVQYYASDWDFMVARAEANGQVVQVHNGVVSTVHPEVQGKPMLLALGQSEIYDFDLHASSRDQHDQVAAVGWNISKQALAKSQNGQPFEIPQGDYDVSELAQSVGAEKTMLMHPVALPDTELKAWADAYVMKSRLSLLQGWIKLQGRADIKVGGAIQLKGMGRRFTGENVITAIRQEVSTENWTTSLDIGMEATWFTAQQNVMDTQAAGLLPGVNGLQIGLVVAYEKDPQNQYRVKVHIPAFDEQNGKVWARLTSPDAGAERGICFRPEVGDEVVVGFLNDDPRQAIVLGSLYSTANKAPLQPTKVNGQKGIFTRKKYQLQFDEENEVITLATSDQHKISIDQKQGAITLEDATGNKVLMDAQGITLASAKDIKISANGQLQIEAKGPVKIGGSKVDLI